MKLSKSLVLLKLSKVKLISVFSLEKYPSFIFFCVCICVCDVICSVYVCVCVCTVVCSGGVGMCGYVCMAMFGK